VTLDIQTFAESTHTAEEAARAVGTDVARIVKSLVFVAPVDGGLEPVLALVSGADRVDVARLSAVVGTPGLRRATAREAGDLTGFVIGGIPPLGHRRAVRVVMDERLVRFPDVWAAAGTSNAVFRVPPATLCDLADATVATIAQRDPPETQDAAGRGGAPGDAASHGSPSGA
jgi:prolyl-tRNA editing enzyme YbaK/EbsC (Cys-tRNA(Pro) deacylase)